uniref:MOSC domain-containing protein n=1 Tax=Xiphophorus couchianus TaxID=32473 RepID=A0A3B5KZS2_9TELE
MFFMELAANALAQNKKAALLVGAAGVALLGFGLGYKYMRKPEKAVRVGVVSQILIHPLKSGKAVPVSVAELWLDPAAVTVPVGHSGESGSSCAETQTRNTSPRLQQCWVGKKKRMFSKDIQGRNCGDKASHWLTTFLGGEKTFRLVHYEPHMKPRRPAESEPLYPQFEVQVAYPDYGPIMLLSEASVQDLSSKLDQEVTTERFRPSIVIGDCEPFDEDSWEEIQIGSVRLQRVMSCGRCILTTVDPETGVMSRKEPLETLKSYRLCKPSEKHIYKKAPLFGQLHTVKKTGVLHVGEEVYKIIR